MPPVSASTCARSFLMHPWELPHCDRSGWMVITLERRQEKYGSTASARPPAPPIIPIRIPSSHNLFNRYEADLFGAGPTTPAAYRCVSNSMRGRCRIFLLSPPALSLMAFSLVPEKYWLRALRCRKGTLLHCSASGQRLHLG